MPYNRNVDYLITESGEIPLTAPGLHISELLHQATLQREPQLCASWVKSLVDSIRKSFRGSFYHFRDLYNPLSPAQVEFFLMHLHEMMLATRFGVVVGGNTFAAGSTSSSRSMAERSHAHNHVPATGPPTTTTPLPTKAAATTINSKPFPVSSPTIQTSSSSTSNNKVATATTTTTTSVPHQSSSLSDANSRGTTTVTTNRSGTTTTATHHHRKPFRTKSAVPIHPPIPQGLDTNMIRIFRGIIGDADIALGARLDMRRTTNPVLQSHIDGWVLPMKSTRTSVPPPPSPLGGYVHHMTVFLNVIPGGRVHKMGIRNNDIVLMPDQQDMTWRLGTPHDVEQMTRTLGDSYLYILRFLPWYTESTQEKDAGETTDNPSLKCAEENVTTEKKQQDTVSVRPNIDSETIGNKRRRLEVDNDDDDDSQNVPGSKSPRLSTQSVNPSVSPTNVATTTPTSNSGSCSQRRNVVVTPAVEEKSGDL